MRDSKSVKRTRIADPDIMIGSRACHAVGHACSAEIEATLRSHPNRGGARGTGQAAFFSGQTRRGVGMAHREWEVLRCVRR